MNVAAAGRAPAHAHIHRPTRPEAAATDGAQETAQVATKADDRPKGGSDTPFTHALHQGNGKKVGIHRRLPTPDEIAGEQLAAGLDPAGPAETEPVVDGAPETVVTADETAPAGPITLDGSVLSGGTILDEAAAILGEAPSTLDLLEQAVEEAAAETIDA